MDQALVVSRFRAALPRGCRGALLRFVDERTETLVVRDGVLKPPSVERDRGAMVTIRVGDGVGYAATADLSEGGLREVVARAIAWAERCQGRLAFDAAKVPLSLTPGEYASPAGRLWSDVPLSERIELLQTTAKALKVDDRIVSWSSSIMAVDADTLLVDAQGNRVWQQLRHISPELEVHAHANGLSQRRTLGGLRGASQQGGVEVLEAFGFLTESDRVARQALELLDADPCPTGTMPLLLAPDQMLLQIHESIGHPLELDRILGDERNYAGTSFVTQDMFGSYRYGSPLLNVTFDPTIPEQYASYAFDDDGTKADKAFLIRDGILERPLGGALSQARAGMEGVANSRASTWHRPTIDRMANLNIEAGNTSFEEMVRGVELGVCMETNRSWSIDDSRNKFQFGCEYARMIRNGALAEVVRDPGYRGVSASFWRSLKRVGSPDTVQVLGTPYCGKGEPNQVIRVGHASPACLFDDVQVFGGTT